ncbi:unnamed protein product [Spirodela intermedia]|uniref:Uncharacterized protein n=1 Tax=Spirodela intermedia TaxID=51605 RepID=A0A7I8J6S1_SPIIN|nr:unnamed protein product [Spirodela intermedia]CAA6665425.1 unnamed protein product [Spirodela intermedia]
MDFVRQNELDPGDVIDVYFFRLPFAEEGDTAARVGLVICSRVPRRRRRGGGETARRRGSGGARRREPDEEAQAAQVLEPRSRQPNSRTSGRMLPPLSQSVPLHSSV